jgi:sugar O-acyltransferase (sialic acid O-acetyltransferase NeuD family)
LKDLIIYGAGGLAREVACLVRDINQSAGETVFRLLGFLVDDPGQHGRQMGDLEVLGDVSWLQQRGEPVGCVIGIGDPRHLARISRRLRGIPGVGFPNIVHPGTIWDRDRIVIGEGNIVTAGNIFTTDISIGSFNIFNLSCTYGHDVTVGDGCVFNPGCNVSGRVTLEGESLVGTGAKILQGLRIGHGATVGAGAVVTKNVEPGTVVVGVPARPR